MGTITLSRPSLRQLTANRPTSSGASATSSATGRDPNRCCRRVAARARCAWSATTTSACSARSRSRRSRSTRRPLPLVAGRARAATRASTSEGYDPRCGEQDAELYHGSPRDPVWDYVITEEAAVESLALTTAPIVLVGHSHVPLALTVENGTVARRYRPGRHRRRARRTALAAEPRLGRPAARRRPEGCLAPARLRRGRGVVPPRGVSVDRTQAEIVERGLPEILATRLAVGQ